MTENDIDAQAYHFVSKIIKFKQPENFANKFQGSVAELDIPDYSDLFNNLRAIVRKSFSDLSDEKIFIAEGDFMYGFSETIYRDFYKFIYKIYEIKKISNVASIDYLKEKVLTWVIEIFINSFSKSNLMNYLEEVLEKDVNKYTFYYPILNVQIEKEFRIGESLITYFTKKQIEEIFADELAQETLKGSQSEVYQKYLGQVFVCVEVIAENMLAQDIAYKKALYFTDVLKLTSPTVCLPSDKCYLELTSKIPEQYEYFFFKNKQTSKPSIRTKFNRTAQLQYTVEMISGFISTFNILGKLNNPNTELEKIIKQSVTLFSNSLSEQDLHLRIIQLVMILESIFLKDNETTGMVNKCKSRFLKLLQKYDNRFTTQISDILSNMYEIRHKMSHKSIRLYIDNNELSCFQIKLVELLTILSQNQIHAESKNELIDFLENI